MSLGTTIEWTDATWNPSGVARRSAPAASTAMPRRSPSGSAGSPAIPTSRGSTCARAREAGRTAPLDEAEDGLRQLDERPVPRRRPRRLHRGVGRRDARRQLAHLPGPDKRSGTSPGSLLDDRLGCDGRRADTSGGASASRTGDTASADRALRAAPASVRFLSVEPCSKTGTSDLDGIAG